MNDIKRSYFLLLILLIINQTLIAQSRDMLMHQGDQAYASQEYLTAQSYYTESDLKEPSIEATYNQANTLFHQDKLSEAASLYERVTDSDDLNLKASAYHNLGNVHMQNQKLDKAIDAYKAALRIKSDDPGTRRNLALARLLKEQNPQQEQQEQQEDSNQNQEQEQEQQQDGEQSQDDNESEEQNQGKEEESQPEDQRQSEAEKLEDMTKQELERLLQVLEEEDKKVQQKAALGKTDGKKTDKEW